MSEHTIDSLTDLDIDEVFALEQASYDFPWTRAIFERIVDCGMPAWGLKINQQLAGYCILMFETEECHILNICIGPQFRGQGWGKCLLEHIIEVAIAEGADQIILEVREHNTNAKALYSKHGFKEIGVRKNYYQDYQGHEDAIVFALDLINSEMD